ncbi:MAG: GAF domain-containing protein [Anaerolineae bacterium]|nr:GAF domain-containing protein [Anaerolineae bacterium]
MDNLSINILLVEDNPGDVRLVREMLADGSMKSPSMSFNLTHVEQLSRALTYLHKTGCDVILLDLSLPDGFGLDTVSQMREIAPDVPIVVMSSLSDEAIAMKAVQQGAQDYLVKGHVDDYSLIHALRYAIERKRIEHAAREQQDLAEALRDIIIALNSTLNLDEILDHILNNVGRVVPHDTANIMLIEDGVATVVGGQGYVYPERPSMVGQHFEIAAMPTLKQMAKTGQSLLIPNTKKHPAWVDLPETHWIRSYTGTPIRMRDRIVGFINLASNVTDFFTEIHAKRLQAFAEQTGIAIGNASLLEAEREQRLLAETLTEVTLALTSQVSLADVLDEILRQVQRLVPYKAANMMLLEGDTLRVARWQGYEKFGNDKFFEDMVQPLVALPLDNEVVKSRKPMIISNTHHDPRWVVFDKTAWVKSNLSVPICLRDRVLGILRLDSDTVDHFSAKDAERLLPLANAAAIALENAQLFDAEAHRRREAETLRKATVALTSALELSQVLDSILTQLKQVIPYHSASILLLKENQLHVVAGQGFANLEQVIGYSYPAEDDILFQEMQRTQWPLYLPDARTDPRFSSIDNTEEIYGWMGVPLIVRGKVTGYLMLNGRKVAAYGEAEAILAQAFANQAAVAIENAQLFEAARQYVAELEAIRQASLSLTSSLDLGTVLEAILESANLLTSLQGARIYLYQDDRLIFGASLWTDGMSPPAQEPTPNGLTYTVARQGEPIVVPDIHDHPLYTDAPPDRKGSVIGLPLKIGKRVVGVMNVEYDQPRIWPESELRMLRLLADQAAIAIENARLFEQAQQEITERKRAENRLNEYREHLEDLVQERTAELKQAMLEAADARDKIDAILQSVADGLMVTDPHHRIILANPAAEELLGVSLTDMLGYEVGAGIKDDRLREMVRSAFDQRGSSPEVDIETEDPRDRRKRVLRTRTALVDDRQGKPLGTVTIIQDVTRLREVDQLKTELLTTTAHELRTPLTSILGFSEILLTRDMERERQEHYLNMIHEQSSHLAKIVAELVDLSRIEAGRGIDLELEQIEMAKLMEEVVMLYAERATKHTIQLEGLVELPPVLGDPFRLTQVGQNLLSNAINYSPQGGTITIRGRAIPDYVEISIQDEGIGMTPEQQEHLFKPFYRAHVSHTTVSGTGLGLATSKLIIEQHRGEVWLESEPGVGTTVYFTLPIYCKQ